MELKFKWLHSCGDASSVYIVETSEPCTVGQLLDLILARSNAENEYGDVSVGTHLHTDVFLTSYKHGKIVDEVPVWAGSYDKGILEEYKNRQVFRVVANGGYGDMDYVIQLAAEPAESR